MRSHAVLGAGGLPGDGDSLQDFTSSTNEGHSVTNNSGTIFSYLDPWKAFDGYVTYYDGTYRALGYTGTSGVFTYEFPNGSTITSVNIATRTSSAQVVSLTIEGSTDESSWDMLLDGQTIPQPSGDTELQSFDLTSTGYYKYYRVSIENDGTTSLSVNTVLNELQLIA